MLPTIHDIEDQTGEMANYIVVCYYDDRVIQLNSYEEKPGEVEIEDIGISLEETFPDLPIEMIGYIILTKDGYTEFLDEIEYEDVGTAQ